MNLQEKVKRMTGEQVKHAKPLLHNYMYSTGTTHILKEQFRNSVTSNPSLVTFSLHTGKQRQNYYLWTIPLIHRQVRMNEYYCSVIDADTREKVN